MPMSASVGPQRIGPDLQGEHDRSFETVIDAEGRKDEK